MVRRVNVNENANIRATLVQRRRSCRRAQLAGAHEGPTVDGGNRGSELTCEVCLIVARGVEEMDVSMPLSELVEALRY